MRKVQITFLDKTQSSTVSGPWTVPARMKTAQPYSVLNRRLEFMYDPSFQFHGLVPAGPPKWEKANLMVPGMRPRFVTFFIVLDIVFIGISNVVAEACNNTWQVGPFPTGTADIGYPSIPGFLSHNPHEIVTSFVLHNVMRPNGVVYMSNDFLPVVVLAISMEDCLLHLWV